MDGQVWIHKPNIDYAPALEGLDLVLEPGEVLGVFGPSGLGKTTLLRGIAGFFPVEGLGYQGSLSMVFQENRLLEDFSLKDNIKALDGDLDLAFNLSKILGLKEAFNQKTGLFSGGMKRRASLIRALSKPFDLLLLDEAFKEVDPAMKKIMYQLVKNREETIIFTSHDLEEVQALGAHKQIILKE